MDVRPKVHIVDDDELVREAVSELVRSVGLEAATYSSGSEFLDRAASDVSGCVIVDMRMPGLSGIELQEQLAQRGFDMPVIVMSAFGDVYSAVRAMKAGAADFIEKPFNNQELLDLIQASLLRDQEARRNRKVELEVIRAAGNLTPREREVMDLVVVGRANKEVARELNISLKTVESHRAKVMEKMAADSLADLVRKAAQLSSIDN